MPKYRVIGDQKVQGLWDVLADSPEEAERYVMENTPPPDDVIDHIETEVWDTPLEIVEA